MNALKLKERLIVLIHDLPEFQQRERLNYIESQKTGYRKHPRTECTIAAGNALAVSVQ